MDNPKNISLTILILKCLVNVAQPSELSKIPDVQAEGKKDNCLQLETAPVEIQKIGKVRKEQFEICAEGNLEEVKEACRHDHQQIFCYPYALKLIQSETPLGAFVGDKKIFLC